MPEASALKSVVAGSLLGVLSSVPLAGGAVAGAIEGAILAAARARDEDWWAMISARLLALESEVQENVNLHDPAFVAAVHRLTRAAQESDDNAKRNRLAAAVALSGSWASIPPDHRDRMERILTSSSSREVFLLNVFADPEAWLRSEDPEAVAGYMNMSVGSIDSFIDGHLARRDDAEKTAVIEALDSLSRAGLVSIPRSAMMTGSGILQPRATSLGLAFLRYLRDIHAA